MAKSMSHKRKYIADNNAIYRLLAKVTPFDDSEVTRLSIPAWQEWRMLKTGQGNQRSVQLLAEVFNACLVSAENVKGDPDELCIEMVKRGQAALQIIIDRHQRLGSWGVCYQTLEHIPPVIEFHDQLLERCTPAQLQAALEEANRRSSQGHVLEAAAC
jgi:riboflavin biosynthesis pyrimidine reductase